MTLENAVVKSRIGASSDGGLLPCRELDEVPGQKALAGEALSETRLSKNQVLQRRR